MFLFVCVSVHKWVSCNAFGRCRDWLLNANCSNMVKATDFKFDMHVPRNSLDMTPYETAENGA